MFKSMRVHKFLFLLLMVLFSAKAQAPLDIRIALVIGNAAYTQVAPLDNAGNDAKAIGQALKALGFTVIELRDGSKVQMMQAIEQVRKSLHGQQALGMLYYAGHGLQLDWHNYMLPVDVRLARASDLPQQAVDVAAVIDVFKSAGTRMNILVLDACRNNPFTKTAGTGKGLAPMDAPPGTLLAYATQPGNVAEDGDAGAINGPYAQYLQSELHRPFARVEDVFKRVRLQVRQKTGGRQIPWESTSLEEDFMFNDGTRSAVKSADLDHLAAEARQRERDMQQRAAQARDREKQITLALEQERQAQAEAAKLVEQQRQVQAAKLKETENLATVAKEKEQQRLAQEAKRAEDERQALLAQAKERERVLAQQQAKEQERQRLLAQAIALEKELDAKRQQQTQALADEIKARETLSRLNRQERAEKIFVAEKVDWDRIRDSKTPSEVYAYLDKHPSGAISELAQAKLEKLDKPKIEPAPDKTGQIQAFEAKRFRQGDSYQFVVRDLLTKIETERPVYTVVKADDETVEFNQGYKLTQAGAIIRTIGGATLDPFQQWIPAGDYQVGKKWHTRSNMTLASGRQLWVEMRGRILARETIQVPAGSFDTYKMEMEQTAQDGTRLKVTYWGQPDWGVAIKQVREVRDTRGALSGQIYELTSRQREK